MTTRTILILIVFFSISQLFSQDTIYTFHYPNGIVTDSLVPRKDNKYFTFSPINNHNLKIVVEDKLVKEIRYANGKSYKNPQHVENREVLFPVDPLTAKIYCSKVIEVKDAKCKDLFNACKTLPQGEIKYQLIASDESEFSFQKYMGTFNVKFAGDPYVMTFNLLIKFKDGKLKYEYSDFVAGFEETRAKGALSGQVAFSSGVYTRTNAHLKILDKMYSGSGMGDEKGFWKPTLNNLNASIAALEKIAKDSGASGNNGW